MLDTSKYLVNNLNVPSPNKYNVTEKQTEMRNQPAFGS